MEPAFWLNNPLAVTGQGAESIPELVLILIILLLIATAVAIITQRLRIPYVTGLVLAGLPINDLLSRQVGLDPFLVLNLFLPILIFEAAINTDISRLRSTFKPIALLAGPGAIFSSVTIGVLVKFGLSLDWIPALLIGIILANTDTVSMIAVFKEIRVPSRLSTIVEGETLFNDAAALVLFNLVLTVYATGSLTVAAGIQQLLVVAVGGTLVGMVLGYLSLPIFNRLDDSLSSLLLTVALALGTFQVGQFLGVSGAVAVVVAGLIFGNLGLARTSSASDQIALLNFWEYAGFGVNTFIFLLIGIEINLANLWSILPSILWVVLAFQIVRAISVYVLLGGLRWFDRSIPLRWQHVLFIGMLNSGVLPKAVYEEMWASYQARVAKSERILRDLYARYRTQLLTSDRSRLDTIRRRLLLAEKGAVNEALRKRIVPDDTGRTHIKDLDEQLLRLEDD